MTTAPILFSSNLPEDVMERKNNNFRYSYYQIITSQFFYEKYLTENDEKIEDSIEFSQY